MQQRIESSIESKMNRKGYVKVAGMAKLNDVAVTQTTDRVLAPILSTQQAVDVFNLEFGDGWQLYRQANQPQQS